MRLPRSLPATLLSLAIATITFASLELAGPAGPPCAMSCCAAGTATSCPMPAASGRPSFRTCRSDTDALPRAAATVLTLPRRADATFELHPSAGRRDAPAAREIWRPSEPAIPPPERLG